MSTLQRLQWLASQILAGRSAFVTFSFNALTRREKVKFTLDSSFDVSGSPRPCVMGALLAVQHACMSSVSTDKGHSSSDGRTVVEFWVQQIRWVQSESCEAADPAGTAPTVAPDASKPTSPVADPTHAVVQTALDAEVAATPSRPTAIGHLNAGGENCSAAAAKEPISPESVLGQWRDEEIKTYGLDADPAGTAPTVAPGASKPTSPFADPTHAVLQTALDAEVAATPSRPTAKGHLNADGDNCSAAAAKEPISPESVLGLWRDEENEIHVLVTPVTGSPVSCSICNGTGNYGFGRCSFCHGTGLDASVTDTVSGGTSVDPIVPRHFKIPRTAGCDVASRTDAPVQLSCSAAPALVESPVSHTLCLTCQSDICICKVGPLLGDIVLIHNSTSRNFRRHGAVIKKFHDNFRIWLTVFFSDSEAQRDYRVDMLSVAESTTVLQA